jgi:proteasome lid subunit RPN8/RPN11
MRQDINSIFNKEILSEVKTYSLEKKTEEVCGLIYYAKNKQKFFKCNNIASNRNKAFIINPDDFEMCLCKGNIICSFHSHNKEGSFSYEDIKESYKNDIPYLLYNIKKDMFYYFDPIK